MRTVRLFSVLLVFGWAGSTIGNSESFTGALNSPEDTFQTTLIVPVNETVTFQTYGFGGGTNAAGTVIPAGGFDPLVAVFSGIGGGATLVDGTSDILSNYAQYAGCPPAGAGAIGGCGDIQMQLDLSAGKYTVLLSDAGYIPTAVFDNGTLSEGFIDLTGGAFQTCVAADSCSTDTANWAFDVTMPVEPAPAPIPEPATLVLTSLGLLSLAAARKRRAHC